VFVSEFGIYFFTQYCILSAISTAKALQQLAFVMETAIIAAFIVTLVGAAAALTYSLLKAEK
jgi:hypothetical protein